MTLQAQMATGFPQRSFLKTQGMSNLGCRCEERPNQTKPAALPAPQQRGQSTVSGICFKSSL